LKTGATVKSKKNIHSEDWLRVSAGGRLLRWRPGALLIRQKPPTSLRRSGCRLPTMRLLRGNRLLQNQRIHRSAQVREPLEPEAEHRHGPKPQQALAGSPANQECSAWPAYGSVLPLELPHHFSRCRQQAAFRWREGLLLFELHLQEQQENLRC